MTAGEAIREKTPSPLLHSDDENPRKPQQHPAIRLWQITGRDASGVFGEILLAFRRLQRIDERPQAGSLDPFHNGGRILEHVIVDRVPNLQPGAERGQGVIITAGLRKIVAHPCGLRELFTPRCKMRDFAHQYMSRLVEIVGHLHREHAAWRQRTRSRCNCLRWPGTHWNIALANSTSVFSVGTQCAILASMKLCPGNRSRACRSMSADVSMPVTAACGQRLASSSVEFPGPHPISTTLRASASGICASRSRAGRVRSFSNLRYCSALQSAMSATVSASCIWPDAG